MSELLERQFKFSCMLPLLYLFISQRGYVYSLGDAYRDKRCPYGHPMSLHRFRLAQDINLFKDGKLLTKTGDHRINDGNHYSLAYRGMK